MLYRNAAAQVSCFEGIECEEQDENYFLWITSIGVAEANAHLCTDSELRQGTILVTAFVAH